MKNTIKMMVAAVALTFVAVTASAEKTVMVGGAAMYPSKDIVDNAVNSKDHTILVKAVQAAGLVETLLVEELVVPLARRMLRLGLNCKTY